MRSPAAHLPTHLTTGKPARPGLGLVLLALVLCFSASHCKKKPQMPPFEVQMQYREQANALCRAVLECIKADVAERLADTPQRRDMVLARMSQDLCLEEQMLLIGSLSTAPLGPTPADYSPELYERYGRCSQAVTATPDCATRRRVYFENPDCSGLRGSSADAED